MAPGSRLPAPAQFLAVYNRPFPTFERWRESYGPRFVVRIPGIAPLVFLADRDDAEVVFNAPPQQLHAGEGGSPIQPIVGPRSFVLADEDEHLRGRMILRESFRRATAERHAPMVAELVAREVAGWPIGEPFALYPRLRSFALTVVLRTIFGETPELPELSDRLLRMLGAASSPVLGAPPTRHLPRLRGIWRRFLRDRADADTLIFQLVDERRRRGARSGDTLDVLLHAADDTGVALTSEYIRDSVMSVVLAGHETTSSALSWAFALLAHEPELQARIATDPTPDAPTSITSATLYEVLRHRSVLVFAVPRAVTSPFDLNGETFTAPALLAPCIHLIHHDPRYYPEPDEFQPERFLTEPPDRTLWLPWGGVGRRRCPGRHLALIELRTMLRTALQRFEVAPTSRQLEPPRWRSVIVTPGNGARVVLRRR